jgi:indolepyruvate ferredoxin oxidoreductase beta subunit
MDAVSLSLDRPISVAIMAMGGQGGGVLADWIVAVAESQGWIAQSTSVPGVAQRTGATIYYVEMMRNQRNAPPVLSLMPVPGDVDVVIAAELMEAGRAIQRGLVAPDRTTLIASSHRSFAVVEKMKPGDGIADPAPVLEAAQMFAQRFLCADMQRIAEQSGSVISSTLFGALAASNALPFAREAFEQTVHASGVGVEASLKAFAGGYEAAVVKPASDEPARRAASLISGGSENERAEVQRALDRIAGEFPADAETMLRIGLRRVVDYQDAAYAHEYLDRVARLNDIDPSLTTEAARQIAVAMCYDDVIRVADLKTRASRFERVRTEVLARTDQIVDTTEFMHPRVAEICGTLPAKIGLAIENSPTLTRAVRFFERGRRVRTTGITGFVPLYLLAGLRRWRRSLLRHQREQAHLNAWLALVEQHAKTTPRLALELLKCRRLVKGYSDTHARGQSKFDKVVGATAQLAHRDDSADWIRRLREAALADEEGKMLDGALATVATL